MTTSFLTINYNGPLPDYNPHNTYDYNKVLRLAFELQDQGLIFNHWNMEFGKKKKRFHLHAKVRSPYRFQYSKYNKDGYQVYAIEYLPRHEEYIMKDNILQLCTNINHRHLPLDEGDCKYTAPGAWNANPRPECLHYDLRIAWNNDQLLEMKDPAEVNAA